MLENLEDVILFASVAHKDQLMIEPMIPYLTHVVAVASNVLEAYYNGNEKFDLDYALKLAILHDTIEDTNVTYDDIKNKYGIRVADGVLSLSKNPDIPYEFRLKDSVERIKGTNKETCIVKLADRTFNLIRKPEKWNKEKWGKYILEAKYIVEQLGFANKYLKEKLISRISENL